VVPREPPLVLRGPPQQLQGQQVPLQGQPVQPQAQLHPGLFRGPQLQAPPPAMPQGFPQAQFPQVQFPQVPIPQAQLPLPPRQGNLNLTRPFPQQQVVMHAPMGPPVPQAFWHIPPGPDRPDYLEDDNTNPPRNAQDARKRYKETVGTFPWFSGQPKTFPSYFARVRLLRQQYSSWSDIIFVQLLADRLKEEAVTTYVNNQSSIRSLQDFMALMETYHGDRTPLPIAQRNFSHEAMTAQEMEMGQYRPYYSRLRELARRAYPMATEQELEEKTTNQFLNSVGPEDVRENVWRMSQFNNSREAILSIAENEYVTRTARKQLASNPQGSIEVNAVTSGHRRPRNHGGPRTAPAQHTPGHQPTGQPNAQGTTPAMPRPAAAAASPAGQHGSSGPRGGPRQHAPAPGKSATMVVYSCVLCGQIHIQGQACPHGELVCWKCLRPGHFKRDCPVPKNSNPAPPRG
jgi:hypothetical protein